LRDERTCLTENRTPAPAGIAREYGFQIPCRISDR
jgi:hypothetical protein